MGSQLFWMRVSAPIVGRLAWFFYPWAWVAGWIGWHTSASRRRNLTRTMLPLCDGDRRRAGRAGLEAFRNVARYWVDIVSLPHRDMSDFGEKHIRLVHEERLAVLDQPGPVIAVSAHTGSPELASQALSLRGRHFLALVEDMHPEAFNDYVQRLRHAGGGEFHSATVAGVRACLKALRRGEVVGVLADRDIQGTGICTQLFGRTVKLPRGPWELARRTNALVLPVFTERSRRDHFTLYIEEPFRVGCSGDAEEDIRAAIQRFASVLEPRLRQAPGQWAVLEDFWRVHACGEG